MLKCIVFLLVLFTYPCHQLLAQISNLLQPNNIEFSAVYDRLLDYYTHDFNVAHAALSGDGTNIFISGKDADSDLVLYTINADGSDMQSVAVPEGVTGIDDVTITADGSRAFFLDSGNDFIYKVEEGSATQILNRTDFSGISNIREIESTANGDFVYLNDGDDIWRIGQIGGVPELIIDDVTVQRDEGTGKNISVFAISADAAIIAFVLRGYNDSDNDYHTKNEVLVYNGTSFSQLTNDTENVYKENLDISGDGSTIVFSTGTPLDSWYSIKTNSSNRIALDGYSSSGVSLTFDGSKVLYKSEIGSRLVNTDGSGGINLFPRPGATAISLGIYDNGYISDDGQRISFRYQIRTFPSRYALYVGHLYSLDAVPDAPKIENIEFDPATMPTDNPDARIAIFTTISDPNGLEDIDEVSIDGLVDGKLNPNISEEVPVVLYADPNDNGNPPDVTADDGIYTASGEPGGKIHEVNQMTVRIGAMDMSSTVVVKDKILRIGGSTGLKENEITPHQFVLSQNYPNPFNPITTIEYAIPKSADLQNIELKIYNTLGETIRTLVNERHHAGVYSVHWDGRDDLGVQLPSGVYLYHLQAGSFIETRKMILVR